LLFFGTEEALAGGVDAQALLGLHLLDALVGGLELGLGLVFLREGAGDLSLELLGALLRLVIVISSWRLFARSDWRSCSMRVVLGTSLREGSTMPNKTPRDCMGVAGRRVSQREFCSTR
jgi:hypothetical protein